MSPGRVLVALIMGAAGGVLAALIGALFGLVHDDLSRQPASLGFFVLGMVLGVGIGLGLGMTEGIYSGSRGRFWRASAYGALGGLLCGFLGFGTGSIVWSLLGGDPRPQTTTGGFLVQMVARSISWGMMGLFVGTVGGLPGLSLRKMRNGAIGGFIGGCVGGFVFQSLATLQTLHGFMLRMVGFGLTGACIGFFVGLVGEAFKQAWVKVLVGRNEGREHVIDSALAYIGRSELVDIPVFLDAGLAPRQASIRFQNGRYYLADEAGRQDTRLRGQVVGAPAPLSDGDMIQLGPKVHLVFYEKATATAASRRAAPAPPQPVQIPAAGGASCQFCGQARDPATGACACSVPGAGVPAYPATGGATLYADPATYAAPMGENPFVPYMEPAPEDPYATQLYGSQPAPFGPAGAPVPGYAGGAEPRLVAVAGPLAGQAFLLGAAPVSIGREAGREIALLGDQTASRRHAAIYPQGGAFLLRDEGSSNGTWVNGARVSEHLLRAGDQVRIGGTTFRFEA